MAELPEVGHEFAGYLLQSIIGRGAMSVVYEADHPRLGNGIALKVLAAEVAADDIFRRRFLDESRIAASMNHPHVIPIYDVGESDGLLYIAMHRVSRGDLRQRIAKSGTLPPQTAVSLLSQATQALDAAHRLGLVHRDVKPANLLIEGDDDAGSEHLYLADFGISRLGMERNGLTSTGHFLGTTEYVAPEQITEPYVYGSADQYSLGCVLYECLTGRVPFEKGLDAGSARPALRTDLPSAVAEMFTRVLAERPGDRYNTCREFMEAARVALADMTTAPPSAVGSHPVQPEPEPVGDQPEPAAVSDQLEPEPVDDQAQPEPADDQPEPEPIDDQAQPEPADDQPEPELVSDQLQPEPVSDQLESESVGDQDEPEPVSDQPEPEPVTDHPAPTPETSHIAAPPPDLYLFEVGADLKQYEYEVPAKGPGAGISRRTRWLVIAAVLLLICAAGAGAHAVLSKQPKASASTSTAMGSKPMPQRAPVSLLTQVLTSADASKVAMGMLPPSRCKQQGTTKVACLAPSPGVASATFTTYPTLSALYAAYKAKVRSLDSGRYRANVENCGLSAPSPYGETAWNHQEQHSHAYTVAEMISGKVSVETAMGRMACVTTAGHSEDIVWTTDYGKMLGVAIGSGSHTRVWLWWAAVHHNIIFPGTPMDMGGTTPLMSGAPMPTTAASTSPSKSARPSPSKSKMAGH
jgi:serine/threonine protein kinase